MNTIVFLDTLTVPSHITIPSPAINHKWTNHTSTRPDEVVERSREASIIVTNKVVISRQHIEQLPKLKHIALIATGYNNIDIEACRDHGVTVSNTRGYANISVPEHTFALIFALRRHLLEYNQRINDGLWQQSPFFHDYCQPTYDLYGSQIGIIGSGELGKGTARIAQALGMKVVFAERKGKRTIREGYQSFDDVISNSDIISLHCPLSAETENLISLAEMQQMKPSALLINTARGGLINEKDLTSAIQNKLIAGTALDVVAQEPISADNPLFAISAYPNVILTPHIAWTSDQALNTQAEQLIHNIECFDRGEAHNLVL